MAMAPENKVHRLGAILVYSSVAGSSKNVVVGNHAKSRHSHNLLYVNMHRCIVRNLTAWVKELSSDHDESQVYND